MKLSAIISTLGRDREVESVLASLEAQSFRDFEVIIVDQNEDDRLAFVEREKYSFPIQRIRTPDRHGLSIGRNDGIRACQGDYVVFPDDDCWYPYDFFERAVDTLEELDLDGLTGRAADENGNSINGRFEVSAQFITRKNVWTTQIEWVAFFRRQLLNDLGGYDPRVGVGADSAWQACEGQELALRAIQAKAKLYYDPSLFGHHESLDSPRPDKALVQKARKYARGHGRVLRMHKYSILDIGFWVSRPSLKAAFYAASLRFRLAIHALNTAVGRLEGYFDPAPRTLHTQLPKQSK
ncbi:MAG: glycosyltransferase family A protein [Pseudomonadota bacterium]